jgi:hypothetical protein
VHFCRWCLFRDPAASLWQRLLDGPRAAIELLRMRLMQVAGDADVRYTPVLPPAAAARMAAGAAA